MSQSAFRRTLILFSVGLQAFAQNHTAWSDYGGSADSAQYSALKQINRLNVNKLEVAWLYPTGDNNKYFFNPLVVGGLMYVLAKNNSIVALDASTGREIWAYRADPEIKVITNRGINYCKARTGRTAAVCLPATTSCTPSMHGRAGRFRRSAKVAASI